MILDTLCEMKTYVFDMNDFISFLINIYRHSLYQPGPRNFWFVPGGNFRREDFVTELIELKWSEFSNWHSFVESLWKWGTITSNWTLPMRMGYNGTTGTLAGWTAWEIYRRKNYFSRSSLVTILKIWLPDQKRQNSDNTLFIKIESCCLVILLPRV